jgi:PST family polysaccharide transporter
LPSGPDGRAGGSDGLDAADGGRGLSRVVIRGAGLAGTGFALTQGLTFLQHLALARLASPTDFGLLAAASLLVGLGHIVTESGMLAAVIQRRDRVEEALNTALVATVLAGLGLSLVALVLSPVVGLVFRDAEVGRVAAALSGVLVLQSLTIIPGAIMQRRFSFARRVVVDPVGVLAFGTVAIGLCALGLGVWGLVFGTYAYFLAGVITSWALLRWRPNLRLASFAMWRELVRFGRHVTASALISEGRAQGQSLIVGRLLGTASLGQLSYAWRMVAIPQGLVVRSVSYVLFPAFARIAADEERMRRSFLRSIRLVAMIAFSTSLLLLPLGEPLAVLLFGERWRPAGQVLGAMCLFGAANAFDSLASELWKATGRPQYLPRMHFLALVTSLSFTAALQFPLGLLGVGVGLSASSTIVAVYAVSRAGHVVGISAGVLAAAIVPSALASIVMAGVLYPLEHLVVRADAHGPVLGLALAAGEALLGGALFVLLIALLSRPARVELRALGRAGWARLPSRSR